MHLADPLKTAVPAPASPAVSRRFLGFCFGHRRSGGGAWRPALFPGEPRRGQRFAFAHFIDPIRLCLPDLHPLETVAAAVCQIGELGLISRCTIEGEGV
jgi:hypothetical protein